MALTEPQRKSALLAIGLSLFSSLSLLSGGSRHLIKMGAELVFGIQARTLGYALMALSIAVMALGIAMVVKLAYESKQSED
jgi:hypothetical protein